MKQATIPFSYTVYDSIEELAEEDASLLQQAREVTSNAYAPYSRFHVGAAAKLANGEVLTGTNQENAAFPAGICAERVLLGTISSLFPAIPVESMALSYWSTLVETNTPISPCGVCRQSLQEYEDRLQHPIRLILGGQSGPVYIIDNARSLLPLFFSGKELGKE